MPSHGHQYAGICWHSQLSMRKKSCALQSKDLDLQDQLLFKGDLPESPLKLFQLSGQGLHLRCSQAHPQRKQLLLKYLKRGKEFLNVLGEKQTYCVMISWLLHHLHLNHVQLNQTEAHRKCWPWLSCLALVYSPDSKLRLFCCPQLWSEANLTEEGEGPTRHDEMSLQNNRKKGRRWP